MRRAENFKLTGRAKPSCPFLLHHVDEAVPGNRQRILEIVRQLREGSSESPEPPGTTPTGSGMGGGSTGGAYKAPGTTPADVRTGSVPDRPEPTGTTTLDADQAEAERLAELGRELGLIDDEDDPT
jgi:hypothetical protein